MIRAVEAVEASYPVFCSYCGAVKGLSAVEHSHGVCKPCFERVWNHFVSTHPTPGQEDAPPTGRRLAAQGVT
jgi:hypothetical protein